MAAAAAAAAKKNVLTHQEFEEEQKLPLLECFDIGKNRFGIEKQPIGRMIGHISAARQEAIMSASPQFESKILRLSEHFRAYLDYNSPFICPLVWRILRSEAYTVPDSWCFFGKHSLGLLPQVNGMNNPFACDRLQAEVYRDTIWNDLVEEVKREDPKIVDKIVGLLGNLGVIRRVEASPAVAARPAIVLTDWNCAQCTYLNSSGRTKCELCDSTKLMAAASSAAAEWACSVCSFINGAARTMCEMCQTNKQGKRMKKERKRKSKKARKRKSKKTRVFQKKP